MDSNTHSTLPPADGTSDDGLGGLITAVDDLAAQSPNRLAATVRARRLLAWRQQLDRQEGLWLQELAALDALGAAGADQDAPAPSTAGLAAQPAADERRGGPQRRPYRPGPLSWSAA
jgi:hypothetical protein